MGKAAGEDAEGRIGGAAGVPDLDPGVMKIPCCACRRPIDTLDVFCRFCGRRQFRSDSVWFYQPVWILILTLTVLGPFSLPLVWRSPKLDRRGKWVFTAAILALTVMLIVMMIKAFMMIVPLMKELDDVLGA